MMKCLSRFRSSVNYESLSWHNSSSLPGVRFAVRRASLMNRLELTKQIKDLTLHHEFLRAGDTADQIEATFADLLARKLYLDWGLRHIEGLRIDNTIATKDSLIEKGPESLVIEALSAVRAEIELSEEERKNF